MIIIQEFDNLRDFILKVDKLINGNYFQNYMLINAILRVIHYNDEYFESYVIGDINSYIVGFCFKGNYLIYGENWTEEQIIVVQNKLNTINYQKGFHISGNKNLVEKLTSSLYTEIFKDRIYYQKQDKLNLGEKFNISLAQNEDVGLVSKMMCEYFEDEYEGMNNKELDKMRVEVESSIEKRSVWILKVNNEIKSMCSIILTQYNIPIIGSFFTNRECRNKKYGTHLLNHVSNNLIDEFGAVTLLADRNHPESIKVFENLKYKNVFENLEIVIK